MALCCSCTTPAEPEVEASVWEDYAALTQAAHAELTALEEGHADAAGANLEAAEVYRGNLRRFLEGLAQRARAEGTRVAAANK